MAILLTGDWSNFGKDDYFRKIELYNMQWPDEINYDNLSVTPESFGGLIALVRNRSQIVKVQGIGRPIIYIYTASCVQLSRFEWNSGTIVQLGWSSDSDLLSVRDDGQVLVYDMFANFRYSFDMRGDLQDLVKEAKIFHSPMGTGIAILSSANRIYLTNSIKSLKDIKIRSFAEVPGIQNDPTAWVVVCEDRASSIIYANGKDLYLLKNDSLIQNLDMNFNEDNYSIKYLAVDSNYTKLAAMTDRGKVWIGDVHVTNCQRLYDSRNHTLPAQLLWCGTDAVAINWGSNVELIGLKDETLKYDYSDTIFCAQEVDCLRVISYHTMDIIQKVPQDVKEIFKISSNCPGSYLLEASKQFQRKSHRANEYLHLVKPKLHKAVQQCIEAASHEFNTDIQKMLIKAAQFGKTYLDDLSPENYITTIRVLRCLNAIRHEKVGIPLTWNQLHAIEIQGLIKLLMIRRNYFLALSITSFLKIPESSKIRLHWAFYKVEHSKHDSTTVAKNIADKIGNSKEISYRDISKKALECNKIDLAIKLIEYEPRATMQIPLLLKLKRSDAEDTTALRKAIESGNTDLVYQVLRYMNGAMTKDKFEMKIRDFKVAQDLYLKYCRQNNLDVYVKICNLEDDHKALAEYHIRECYDNHGTGMKDASLQAAKERYKLAKLECNTILCEEQSKLIKFQNTLEDKLKRSFRDKSINDTIKTLLELKDIKTADKLKTDYKVPDRRYWWLRIEVLGKSGNWSDLEAFSKHKKSPIGYEPFIDICLKYNEIGQARLYLSKVLEENKVKYLGKLGMINEAADLAFNQKDVDALKALQMKCDPYQMEKITSHIRQLTK